MLTAAGSGYSRWGDLAVTRWREDATCDDLGSYVFLRDVRSGRRVVGRLSAERRRARRLRCRLQRGPRRVRAPRRNADDDVGGARLGRRRCRGPPRLDLEFRRPGTREIDVTSYAELVLARQAADVAHPAFSKLFVETEYLADVGAILATRRRRSPSEPEIWAAHLAVVDGEAVGKPEIETDRARFLGRGRGVRAPIAVIDGRPLSNTVGTVLDPIFALRRRVRVAPGAIVRIAFWTMVASTPRGAARPRRQASRRDRLRARGDARLDAGAGAAPSPRHRPRAKPACSSVSPDTCSMPRRRCARPPTRSVRGGGANPGFGRRAFPAICRSCCCASPTPRTSTSRASCCRRTNTGG